MIEFFVPGVPAPGGSKKYVGHSKAGRAIIIDAAGQKNKNWRASVEVAAHNAMLGRELMRGALKMELVFVMPRPKAHYGKKGLTEKGVAALHVTKPDLTKLVRSTEDAMKGIVWLDDSQIVVQLVEKRYSAYDIERIGCYVKIQEVWEI